ncbi:hypothetical protein BU26DRAFT_556426 [Trematosphaeria pertusa]|uniref:Uncharacterized protein n=1 Tax=Trematosphaeria pertusa TaxID=390896 RepID=A0A6A6HU61_9PLEO|nr:uncharacterized protein BU26DRAFT_556426 [Trematosphaeria pertusa]KAF2240960.1 hypothetical protein BU26DRAFT_556426 [Trematosphaeria pertusa]
MSSVDDDKYSSTIGGLRNAVPAAEARLKKTKKASYQSKCERFKRHWKALKDCLSFRRRRRYDGAKFGSTG